MRIGWRPCLLAVVLAVAVGHAIEISGKPASKSEKVGPKPDAKPGMKPGDKVNKAGFVKKSGELEIGFEPGEGGTRLTAAFIKNCGESMATLKS